MRDKNMIKTRRFI